MVDSVEKLNSIIRLRFRFLKAASEHFGYKTNRDYQRFRNTVLGASKDYQVIAKLLGEFKDLDTKKIWGVEASSLQSYSNDQSNDDVVKE